MRDLRMLRRCTPCDVAGKRNYHIPLKVPGHGLSPRPFRRNMGATVRNLSAYAMGVCDLLTSRGGRMSACRVHPPRESTNRLGRSLFPLLLARYIARRRNRLPAGQRRLIRADLANAIGIAIIQLRSVLRPGWFVRHGSTSLNLFAFHVVVADDCVAAFFENLPWG